MQGHIRKRTHTTKAGRQTVNWYVVVDSGRDEIGKRRQKWHGGFRTRKAAEVARAKIVGDLHAGTYTEPTRITLSEWVIERWLPNVDTQVKPSTFESYARNMRHHVLPTLGDRMLTDIGPSQLNSLYTDLLNSGRRDSHGGLSPKTVRYIHTIIHKALSDALDVDLVPSNTAERAKPPKPKARTSSEIKFWQPRELRCFLDPSQRAPLASGLARFRHDRNATRRSTRASMERRRLRQPPTPSAPSTRLGRLQDHRLHAKEPSSTSHRLRRSHGQGASTAQRATTDQQARMGQRISGQ